MSLDETTFSDSHDAPLRVPASLRMTEEEFAAWCDEDTRAEWVRGEVIMMSPANLDHVRLASWLARFLSDFVEPLDLGEVLPDVWVRLGSGSSRRAPDIAFVATEHAFRAQEGHVEGPPDLIVEIVSQDSEARDWREKYLEYQAAGVREYWVVNPATRHAEFYELVEGSYCRLPEEGGWIASKVLRELRLKTAWLWPPRPKVTEALREVNAFGSK